MLYSEIMDFKIPRSYNVAGCFVIAERSEAHMPGITVAFTAFLHIISDSGCIDRTGRTDDRCRRPRYTIYKREIFMCTALRYVSQDVFFGRTLDNDSSYNEEIVIAPRRRRLNFRDAGDISAHYAILGIAAVMDGCPLYYDACNEKGLGAAGLNFVGNAVYNDVVCGKDNIAHFEVIPWVLAQCATVNEAEKLLSNINITKTQFKPDLPVAQLHWIIADKNGAITVECEKDGLHIYRNPVGVLTNNPPFPLQLFNLNNYMGLSTLPPQNTFSDKIALDKYCRGMGGLGLPGDVSSQSRFVRAAFTALNSPICSTCLSGVSQFFHIMENVGQTRGVCKVENGGYETTIYTSCMDMTKGILYYTCYDNRRISAVDMNKANLDGTALVRFPMMKTEQIFAQN